MNNTTHFYIIDDSFEEAALIRSGIKSYFKTRESPHKVLESGSPGCYTNKYRSGIAPFEITEMSEPSIQGIGKFLVNNRKSLSVIIVDMVWSEKEKSEVYDKGSGLFNMEFSKMFSRIDELYRHKEDELPGGLRFFYNWFKKWEGMFDVCPVIIAKSVYFTPELKTSLRALGVTKFLDSDIRNNEALLSNFVRECIDETESRRKIFGQQGSSFSDESSLHLFPAKIHKKIQAAAGSDDPVLMLGNEGTGKRSLAEFIHSSGKRKGQPFVVFNCGGGYDEDINQVFFGNEGLFSRANEGALYLGAINMLPAASQEKLLSVLKDGRFWSPEQNKFTEVNVRLFVSIQGDPLVEIESGKLSSALYHRLKIIDISLPSLVERKSEIKVLAEHFINKYKLAYGKPMARISDEAVLALKGYLWPGNVRELENTIKKALMLCEKDSSITVNDLQLEIRLEETDDYENTKSLSDLYIKKIALAYLRENGRNIIGLAAHLGLTRQAVYPKLKKLGIDINDYSKKK